MVKILSGPCLALSRSGVPESKYTFTKTPLKIITYNTSEVLSLQIESFVIFILSTDII